jgi:hypothetical protein
MGQTDEIQEMRDLCRRVVLRDIEALLEAGMTPKQALDYWVCEVSDERTPGQWADVREVNRRGVYDSLARARETIHEGEVREGESA